MKNKKSGFTLLEVIVSIVLISILSLGFLQIVTANSGVSARSEEYNQGTYDFAAAIDMGVTSYNTGKNEITVEKSGSVNLQLGKVNNAQTMSIDINEVKYSDASKKRAGSLSFFGNSD